MSFLNGVLNAMPMDERVRILCVSSAQCVLVFMAAPVLTARLESKNPLATLSLNKTPYWLNVTCIMACYITGISFLNQIIYWNDALTLPDNWNALEQTMRSWEENSRELTNVLLSTTSIGGLISGVLIYIQCNALPVFRLRSPFIVRSIFRIPIYLERLNMDSSYCTYNQ